MKSLLGSVLTLLLLLSPVATAKEKVTSDPKFEARLTSTSTYITGQKDTLRSIAHLLYGHRSWWPKLKEDNSEMQKYRPDQKLPKGVRLQYRTPEMGSQYTVKENDWLIRILRWKYGHSEHFDDYVRKNGKKISNPNLIHLGDKLLLSDDGTVRLSSSKRVLLDGYSP